MSLTMRLLKCPACGGPLDPPAGESTMKCTYCGNAVVIPESLRLPKQVEHDGLHFIYRN